MHISIHVTYRYCCQISRKHEISDRVSRIPRISDFLEIRPVGVELVDGEWKH